MLRKLISAHHLMLRRVAPGGGLGFIGLGFRGLEFRGLGFRGLSYGSGFQVACASLGVALCVALAHGFRGSARVAWSSFV